MAVRSLVRYPYELWRKYERRLSAIGIATGFVFDLIIADRPDSPTNNMILLSYLCIAGALLIVLNLRTIRRRDIEPMFQPLFLLFALQFAFGGLASNLLVLYGRSGTFAASALFLIILGAMLIGNEFMRSQYSQLRFNIVVYYVLLLTYLVIAVPTFIFHSVGTMVFLASGAISLVIIAVFLALVYYVVLRGRERAHQLYEVSVLVALVFILFNGLYFLKIIPPVPLSLKNIGVYHSLERLGAPAGGSQAIYTAEYEPAPWYVFWRDTSSTFTISSPKDAVCFSSVFAPSGLQAPVFHRWERYSEEEGEWIDEFRTSFAISGGREGGFRGFTDGRVTPGKWRCNVETQNGALIGRISFTVTESAIPPALSQKTL
ncbi:MAG TPA: DUF2914 domain-containing protein [Candidatus Paceibacterota bacterium]|nr:DUF2914 domain-containing protein [Candidatus Paceibacterota bacterium]